MARENTDKNEGLTPAEQKQAEDAASAAGRKSPDATDVRDAVKAHEQDDERPKNDGNVNRTGSQDQKKDHHGPKEH